RNGQNIDRQLACLFMDLEVKAFFQQLLQHRPIHLRDGSIAPAGFDIPCIRLRPIRTAENLHSARILTDAVRKHAVRSLNIILGRKAPDGKSSRRGRTAPTAPPTSAIRARLDGSGFELSYRLGRGKKRRGYQSAQDMSHTDMLHHAASPVKRIL